MYHYQPPTRNGLHHKDHLIKVTGEGELAIQPDSASVNIGVITEGKELLTAQEQNSLAVKNVIDALLAIGISQHLIQTFDYRIESEYDFEQGKQLFRGYKITHLLQVKIDDLSLAGKVVDTTVQNGANYVSSVQFTVKDKESYYLQALTLALTNALDKAKTIAASINVTLIPIPRLVVEEMSSVQPLYHQAGAFVKGISSTQFEPGQIKVRAMISAEYNYQANYQGPL